MGLPGAGLAVLLGAVLLVGAGLAGLLVDLLGVDLLGVDLLGVDLVEAGLVGLLAVAGLPVGAGLVGLLAVARLPVRRPAEDGALPVVMDRPVSRLAATARPVGTDLVDLVDMDHLGSRPLADRSSARRPEGLVTPMRIGRRATRRRRPY